jgi:hypothetical protein
MAARVLAQFLYGLVGVAFLAAGGSVLLLKTGLLPPEVSDLVVREAGGNMHTLHVLQEFSSLMVFAGLIAFWFLWHYDRSGAFHWALTAFWGLFALVHWFDVRGPVESARGPALNTIPFALFVLVGLLRTKPPKGPRAAGG